MTTVKRGSKGEDVRTVQRLLNAKGFSCGAADGIFGVKTEAAVKAFQKAKGLAVDGIVGAKTWNALLASGGNTPGTAHFKVSEFKCHNGAEVPVKYYDNLQRLMCLLEEIRAACGNVPIHIQSGYRTKEYNAKQKGASPRSQHLTASAADIKVKGMSPADVYKLCDRLVGARGGVGKYKGFTHVDVRGYRARWGNGR